MKTFNDLRLEFCSSNPDKPDNFGITLFCRWLDQRYAPAALPGGAQLEAPPSPSEPAATGDESVAASRAPAADNGGGVSFPQQPIELDRYGVRRFRKNAIVAYLLDSKRVLDMNELALLPFSDADRSQFAQLIGYSLSGYAELGYTECFHVKENANGGGVSFREFPDGVVLHFSYEQLQNNPTLVFALSNLMMNVMPRT